MNKQFLPYEQALELKKLGFAEPCFSIWEDNTNLGGSILIRPIITTIYLNGPYYNEYYGYEQKYINDKKWKFVGYRNSVKNHDEEILTAPLWSQTFDWFREKYSMSSFIKTHYEYQKSYSYHIDCEYQGNIFKDMYDSYEEARLECLKKLIEIIKEKENGKSN